MSDKNKIETLTDVYYSIKIGVEISNDEAWLLWHATDTDKQELMRRLKTAADEFESDLKTHNSKEKTTA